MESQNLSNVPFNLRFGRGLQDRQNTNSYGLNDPGAVADLEFKVTNF